MNKKKLTLSIALSGLLVHGAFANNINKGVEDFDLDSIEYIEEEEVIELGFDTADYLPEGFDPYEFYFDLNWVEYIDMDNLEEIVVENHLPENFDPYADPKGIEGINYIDPNDEINLDLDTVENLPKGFDPYL